MNLWSTNRGSIKYIVCPPDKTIDLVKSSNRTNLAVFAFGDNWRMYKNHIDSVLFPNSIEQMSMMIRSICKPDRVEETKYNFLVDDAYIMQSRSRSASGKGSSIKGFISTFRMDFKRSRNTMIFVSEIIDKTLERNFAKFPENP